MATEKSEMEAENLKMAAENLRMLKIIKMEAEKSEAMKHNMRPVEFWIARNQLPSDMTGRIISYIQHRLEQNKDFDMEKPIPQLPNYLTKEIKHPSSLLTHAKKSEFLLLLLLFFLFYFFYFLFSSLSMVELGQLALAIASRFGSHYYYFRCLQSRCQSLIMKVNICCD